MRRRKWLLSLNHEAHEGHKAENCIRSAFVCFVAFVVQPVRLFGSLYQS